MTGEVSPPDVRHGMELGADDYLPKPFAPRPLLAAIDTRLGKHAMMRDQAEEKFRQRQKALAKSISNELLAPMDDLLVLTELIGKGCRASDRRLKPRKTPKAWEESWKAILGPNFAR